MVNDGKNRIILRNTLIFTSHHPYSSSTKTLAYTLRQQVWYFLPQFHHMPANTNSELPNYHSQETVEMSNMGRGSCLSPFPPLYHSLSSSQVPTTDSFTNSLSVLIRSTLVKETISRFKTSGTFYAPVPITHQYPDILNPWSKVKTGGNRPRKSSLQSGHCQHIRPALVWLLATVTGCMERGQGNRTPLDWYTIPTYNPVRQPLEQSLIEVYRTGYPNLVARPTHILSVRVYYARLSVSTRASLALRLYF